jgi:carbonic anhydrase
MSSDLAKVLDMMGTINFRQLDAGAASQIGGFLERAAVELSEREGAVSDRERQVSKREADVQLREDNVEKQLRALASVQSVRKTLDRGVQQEVRRVGWFGRKV